VKNRGLKLFIVCLAGCSSPDDTLLNLEISQGSLSPAFASSQTSYTAGELFYVETVTLTPTATDPRVSITVAGQPVLSGMGSQALLRSEPICGRGDRSERQDEAL
jgi:hypothetical protein